MGMENDVMLSYLEDNERFADLFNFVYFDGTQVVKPCELEEASEIYPPKPEGKKRGRDNLERTRIRDIKKRMKSGEELKILAMEAQSAVNYTMPWRCMDYDCREYGKQITQVQRANSRADKAGETVYADAGERLSRFRREDKIAPVYTLCLYHGVAEWDGPRSLKDMMEFGAGKLWERFFADYPMRLVCVNECKDLSGLKTSLREVFGVLSYREDKEKLRRELQENPAYESLDEETAEAISVLMGVEEFMEKREKYQEGKKYNMCKALREMMEDSRMEGHEAGHAEGHAEGHAAGIHCMQALILKMTEAGEGDKLSQLSDEAFYEEMLQKYGLQ